MFEQDGWNKTNKYANRGAEYSFLKNLPNKTRYHMRLYEIDEYFYFLNHHEPSFSSDPKFHIIGLFDRFRSKKENVLNSEKLELANYEKGIEYFKQLVNKYAVLPKICNFYIDEDELKFFAMKFGYVSLKLPVEILIEDLKDALVSDDKEEFNAIIRKLFQVMEFKQIEVNPEFLVFESPSIKHFIIFIQKIKLNELDLTKLGRAMKNFKVTSTVLIPRKQDDISAELTQKAEYLNITLIQPSNFLKIFNIYRNSPITHEQLQLLFKGGLINSTFIDETLQTVNFSDLLIKTMELFGFLKEQTAWTYFETLEYEFIDQRDFTLDELKSILNFLTYPVINLVITKTEKRRFRRNKTLYRALSNFDEIQFRLKNIKKFLSKIT
ncbi:MAG: hypothetical protein HWN66_01095 [Candidatus Helarchaeota archaeon]|nr:hypothetical protein [Candidatus Helarchaeota archaeon]